jgi:hypothetical protein
MKINPWAKCLLRAGQRHAPHDGPARIVSLVPSLTELVCDLGLAPQLVGRTGFCIHPAPDVANGYQGGGHQGREPRARLRALAPTHIIVNVDENRRECVEEIATFVPNVIVTHPCAPEDNVPVYRLLGAIFGRRAESERLATALEAALAEARAVGAALPREKGALPDLARALDDGGAGHLHCGNAGHGGLGYLCRRSASPATRPSSGIPRPGCRRCGVSCCRRSPIVSASGTWRRSRHLSGQPASLIDGEMASWYGSRAIDGLRYLAALRRSLAA